MRLNQIFHIEDYEKAYNYIILKNYTIKEIESMDNVRRFQIVEKEKPSEEEQMTILRSKREFECFSVVNRGALWYEGITVQQYLELQKWYKDWLDVTETKIIPSKPEWLK